jgi:hypothetical protein
MILKRRVKCFYQDLSKCQPYYTIYIGIQPIEVKSIIGTVDKGGELDMMFNYIHSRRRDWAENLRRYCVCETNLNYQFYPPIKVNGLKGRYYVVDGHRRVAAAKRNGVDYIDADVTEYLQQFDTAELGRVIAQKRESAKSAHSMGANSFSSIYGGSAPVLYKNEEEV